MVLDLNRSTRPGLDSTAKLLLPLIEEFQPRVTVSLFRSPSLRGIMAKIVPPRFNEGWGTWHAKIYGVDDDVMISGCVARGVVGEYTLIIILALTSTNPTSQIVKTVTFLFLEKNHWPIIVTTS